MSKPKKQPNSQQAVTAHIFLVIDEKGNWMARGEGSLDDWERSDHVLPAGEVFSGWKLGNDDAALEFVEVVVEVPVPVGKVLEGRLF